MSYRVRTGQMGQIAPTGDIPREALKLALDNSSPITRIGQVLIPGLKYVIRETGAGFEVAIVGSVVRLPQFTSAPSIVVIPVGAVPGPAGLDPVSSFLAKNWRLVSQSANEKLAAMGVLRNIKSSPVNITDLDSTMSEVQDRLSSSRTLIAEKKLLQAEGSLKLAREGVDVSLEQLKVMRDVGLLSSDAVTSIRVSLDKFSRAIANAKEQVAKKSGIINDAMDTAFSVGTQIAFEIRNAFSDDTKRSIKFIHASIDLRDELDELILKINLLPSIERERFRASLASMSEQSNRISAFLLKIEAEVKRRGFTIDQVLQAGGFGGLSATGLEISGIILTVALLAFFVFQFIYDVVQEERRRKQVISDTLLIDEIRELRAEGKEITPEQSKAIQEQMNRTLDAQIEFLSGIGGMTTESRLAALNAKEQRRKAGLPFRVREVETDLPTAAPVDLGPILLSGAILLIPLIFLLFPRK